MAYWELKNRIFVKVDAYRNNNKEYRIKLLDDRSGFVASYGRMRNDGTLSQSRTYPMSDYCKVCDTRISHGYREIACTDDDAVSTANDDILFHGIDDLHVEQLMRRLLRFSRSYLNRTYKLPFERVNAQNLRETETYINLMAAETDVDAFNDHLQRVFELIPRSMDEVGDFLARDSRDFAEIVSRERANIDILKTQKHVTSDAEDFDAGNIIERLGIEVRYAPLDEFRMVRRQLDGGLHQRVKSVYRIKNKETDEAFDNFKPYDKKAATKLLWHGSRNENWLSILENGLVLRPNAVLTGKMFGSGIYFAPSAQKSFGYTSARGSYWARGTSDLAYMALFECKYGKPMNVNDATGFSYNFSRADFEQCFPKHDCVHAHAGKALRNDEIIFYDPAQVTMRYIVEFNGRS